MLPHVPNPFAAIHPAALADVASDYAGAGATNLLDRWQGLDAWRQARDAAGLNPGGHTLFSENTMVAETADPAGCRQTGLNFAGEDPLNLATHPAIRQAAAEALAQFGPHTAALGSTPLALQLEEELANFLSLTDATLFPSGWAAGYGAMKTLLAAGDHCVIDAAAHPCLQEGALAAGATLHRTQHLVTDAIQSRLRAIRAAEPHAGILVVTETQFALDAAVTDLEALQALCHSYEATLAVLAAQDLGCLGAAGRGQLELQRMTGRIDVVIGCLGKTFAAQGGFVASNTPALKTALRYHGATLATGNALPAPQAAAALAALSIIRSTEGAGRRARLLRNILHLRERASAAGFRVLGEPAAILPLHLGDTAQSRLATRFARESGAFVSLAEHPAVPRRTCRWLCHVMAGHSATQIDRFAQIAAASRKKAANWLSAHALASDQAASAA